MPERTAFILPRHVRRRRPSFVLTSLIDVIFLLVIFFMVSSQIVPFSLLPLGPLAANDGEAAPAAAGPPATPPVAVRILGGRVVIGGESVAVADVSAALADLKARGITDILLAPGAAATVQDVVTVLEASKTAGLANVTVLNRAGGQP